MDPFVRKLVERMLEPTAPLTRNRHFHVFDNPEGRRALKVCRRLRALQLDIRRCLDEGGRSEVRTVSEGEDAVRVEIRLEGLSARRTTHLDEAEYVLLRRLPGMAQVLAASP